MPRALERFIRYGMVGGSTLLIDLTILYVLTEIFSVHYQIGIAIGFLIAVSINYLVSRRWVFKHTDRGFLMGYVFFIKFALVGLFLTMSITWYLVEILGIYYLASRLGAAGIVGVSNYLSNLYLNFRVAGKHLL